MNVQLVRFRPDAVAFQRWAHRQKLLPSGVDEGYAWHALLKTVLGEFAPQPFAVRGRAPVQELLAYTESDTRLWTEMAQDTDAVEALRLSGFEVKTLPDTFKAGDRLSFEVRVRPIVRSRNGRDRIRELDAAAVALESDPAVDRESVYIAWLSHELNRGSAARLSGTPRIVKYRRTRVLRRTQGASSRQKTKIEGPDVLFRGQLEVEEPHAFSALLTRGLGRHRAFGFGCLLVAPPGTLR